MILKFYFILSEDYNCNEVRVPEITEIKKVSISTDTNVCENMKFISKYITKCIGMKKIKKLQVHVQLFTSISDDAFACVVYKNNEEKWDNQYKKKRQCDKTDEMDSLLLLYLNSKDNKYEDTPQAKQTKYTKEVKMSYFDNCSQEGKRDTKI